MRSSLQVGLNTNSLQVCKDEKATTVTKNKHQVALKHKTEHMVAPVPDVWQLVVLPPAM